jgi:Spy/CpxP family protein refolding chaperone
MRRLLALTILVAGIAAAQAPRAYFPWWDSAVVRDLNLSSDQARQIRQNVKEYRVRLLESRAAVERAELDLEQIFNDDNVDQKKANDAIERLVNARSEMTRAFAQMSIRLRTVLTAEQWQQLQQRRPLMEKERERKRQGGGAPKQGSN